MKAKDTEARYSVTSVVSQLVGDIVGAQALGDRIVSSLFLPDEKPSERNVQNRLREALQDGTLQVRGLGPQRLKRLQSAIALGKALYADVPEVGTVIDDSSVAARAFHQIAWESVEKFAALALDVKHRVLSTRIISSGTATETYAHPRDIFRWVMMAGGSRCVVAHNHPSGSVHPSPEDLQLTEQLVKVGELLGIPVMDHLIVSGSEYLSIRQTSNFWKG